MLNGIYEFIEFVVHWISSGFHVAKDFLTFIPDLVSDGSGILQSFGLSGFPYFVFMFVFSSLIAKKILYLIRG